MTGTDDNEHTVVVDRGASPATPHADEHTVVVDRGTSRVTPDADEHTVVVDRGIAPATPDDNEHTVVVDRTTPATPDDNEHTVAIDRATTPAAPTQPTLAPRPGQRRRGMAPPPVPEGFAPTPTEAVGPGAVEAYAPRAITPPPVASEPLEEGPQATRAAAPAMPSAMRNSRRRARAALVIFAISCVIAAGAAALIVWRLLPGQ